MRYLKTLLSIILLLSGPVSASNFFSIFGDYERGSGVLESVDLDLDNFTKIKTSGSSDIYITLGEKQEVTITFDDNLIEMMKTRVRGKTLKIGSKSSFRSDYNCRFDITIKSLEEISLSGSGKVFIENMNGDFLEVQISGSGEVYAKGEVEELDIRVSGSGSVDSRELKADDVSVSVSGSGGALVYASNSFDGNVSGSGDIRYFGNPGIVDKSVSGSGSIKKRRSSSH